MNSKRKAMGDWQTPQEFADMSLLCEFERKLLTYFVKNCSASLNSWMAKKRSQRIAFWQAQARY